MATLYSEKCTACRRDSPRVTDDEIKELHPQIADWEIVEVDGVPRLKRTFPFSDFQHAMDFADRVGQEAEEEGHHPRITFEWGRVGIEWWTHKIRGMHRNDFVMAAKSDEMYKSAAGKPE